MLVLSDQTLQIVYLETANQAQMQKILPSNQIVAMKHQHIFQLIKIQNIAHYILYGLHELSSRNTAEDRCLDRIFLSFSRYATNCAIHIYILIILDLSRNINAVVVAKLGVNSGAPEDKQFLFHIWLRHVTLVTNTMMQCLVLSRLIMGHWI